MVSLRGLLDGVKMIVLFRRFRHLIQQYRAAKAQNESKQHNSESSDVAKTAPAKKKSEVELFLRAKVA